MSIPMTSRKTESGYHIHGPGVGNNCFPKRWPCPPEELEKAFEEGAEELFKQQVRDLNRLEVELK